MGQRNRDEDLTAIVQKTGAEIEGQPLLWWHDHLDAHHFFLSAELMLLDGTLFSVLLRLPLPQQSAETLGVDDSSLPLEAKALTGLLTSQLFPFC